MLHGCPRKVNCTHHQYWGILRVLEPVLQEGVIGSVRYPYKNPPIIRALRTRPRGSVPVAPVWQLRGVLPHRTGPAIHTVPQWQGLPSQHRGSAVHGM
jgi:hypothetical protein